MRLDCLGTYGKTSTTLVENKQTKQNKKTHSDNKTPNYILLDSGISALINHHQISFLLQQMETNKIPQPDIIQISRPWKNKPKWVVVIKFHPSGLRNSAEGQVERLRARGSNARRTRPSKSKGS